MSNWPATHKHHRKHMHHVLVFMGLVSGAIITLVVSMLTLKTETVCSGDIILPNNPDQSLCLYEEQTSYGWPARQFDYQPIWPTLGNYVFYTATIFALAKAEAHHKGHMSGPKSKK